MPQENITNTNTIQMESWYFHFVITFFVQVRINNLFYCMSIATTILFTCIEIKKKNFWINLPITHLNLFYKMKNNNCRASEKTQGPPHDVC